MKKVLILLMFLLNLLPNISNNGMGTGFATISAQTFGNEGVAYLCEDEELSYYISPLPCDEEVCVEACTYPECPYSGPCEDSYAHYFLCHFENPSYDGNDTNENNYFNWYNNNLIDNNAYNGQDGNNNQLAYEKHKEMVLKWVAAFNEELKALIDKLSKEQKIKIMERKDNIIVKMPRYYPKDGVKDGVIILPMTADYGAESLTHEVIHYLQDMLKNLNYSTSSSNNEYQAYVLNYFVLTAYGDHPSSPKFEDASSWNYFISNLEGHYGKDKSGIFWYDAIFDSFIESFDHMKMLNSFADYYKSINGPEGYYKHINPHYLWKWSDILNRLGFKKK